MVLDDEVAMFVEACKEVTLLAPTEVEQLQCQRRPLYFKVRPCQVVSEERIRIFDDLPLWDERGVVGHVSNLKWRLG